MKRIAPVLSIIAVVGYVVITMWASAQRKAENDRQRTLQLEKTKADIKQNGINRDLKRIRTFREIEESPSGYNFDDVPLDPASATEPCLVNGARIIKTLDELKELRKAESDKDTDVMDRIRFSRSRAKFVPKGYKITVIHPNEANYAQIEFDGFRGWIEADYLGTGKDVVGDTGTTEKPSTPKTELVPIDQGK